MIFTKQDYKVLHATVFQPDYPGYRPELCEVPNGDGKVDVAKRFAHVAHKYHHPDADTQSVLYSMLGAAHREAERVARKLRVPDAFMPDIRYGALRILEYPVGVGSEQHTDFDLFTILCYRNDLDYAEDCPLTFIDSEDEGENGPKWKRLQRASPGMHVGEIGEIVGLGKATPHLVKPGDHVQHSIVYFAIPDHAVKLPLGHTVVPRLDEPTVGEWITERIARSRVYK